MRRKHTINDDCWTNRMSPQSWSAKSISISDGYSFAHDGLRLGWGLRNSVGVAEHPQTGGIYSV